MSTLTIRKVDDDVAERLKTIARHNHRSVESEVRSLIEDYTAGLLLRREQNAADVMYEIREALGGDYLNDDDLALMTRERAAGERPNPFADAVGETELKNTETAGSVGDPHEGRRYDHS